MFIRNPMTILLYTFLHQDQKNIQLNGFETESIDYASDTTVYLRAVKDGRQISSGFFRYRCGSYRGFPEYI